MEHQTDAKKEWEAAIKNKESPEFMIFKKLHDIVEWLEIINNNMNDGFYPEY
jgi:hypothetical protein